MLMYGIFIRQEFHLDKAPSHISLMTTIKKHKIYFYNKNFEKLITSSVLHHLLFFISNQKILLFPSAKTVSDDITTAIY